HGLEPGARREPGQERVRSTADQHAVPGPRQPLAEAENQRSGPGDVPLMGQLENAERRFRHGADHSSCEGAIYLTTARRAIAISGRPPSALTIRARNSR